MCTTLGIHKDDIEDVYDEIHTYNIPDFDPFLQVNPGEPWFWSNGAMAIHTRICVVFRAPDSDASIVMEQLTPPIP